MKNIILIFVLFFYCLNFAPSNTILIQPAEDFIILATLGQSNAASYAICPDVLPTVPEGIYNFGNDYVMHIAQEPIDSIINQVDMVSSDTVNRCGSAITIATELNRITGRDVVIVPCAKGGMTITQWQPAYTRDTLYGSCLYRIRTVDTGGNHTVMIFFYQGEADSYNLDLVAAWNGKFTNIINALNTDLNYPPIVYAQVSKTTDPQKFPYLLELANEQAFSRGGNVLMVKSEDLSLCDIIHLDYESQQILGKRAAVLLYWLMKQK